MRTNPADQVKPPPIVAIIIKSPDLMRPDFMPVSSAMGIEAEDMLAVLSMVKIKRSSGMFILSAMLSIILIFA